MASNAPSTKAMESLNPCCAQWRTSYAKIEKKRDALREGLKILQQQIDRLQLDNANLQKACDEGRARLNVVEEESRKEASLRISMEEEIAALKSEISSTKPEVASGNVDFDKEATHLRTCISENEVEIDRLKQLLDVEKMRADAEKTAAETERKNAAELQKSLEYAKMKANEASEMAEAAARDAEDHRSQLENLKNEIEKTNLKWEEMKRKLEAEKQNAINQKQCSDERVKEEECRATDICKQLDEEKKKVEKLQKEMQEIVSSKKSADCSELDEVKKKLEAEKKKVAREKRHVELEKARVIEQRKIAEANEKRVAEEKWRADKLSLQLEEEKQKFEKYQKEMQNSSHIAISSLELEELKQNLEDEKNKAARAQKCMEDERATFMEQRRIAEANEKKCSEEKCRADKLFILLEEEKQKAMKLQREVQEVSLSQKAAYSSEIAEIYRNLEEEKKNVARERDRADLEMSRKEEQKRLAELSIQSSIEEKCRAEKLRKELECSRDMIEKLDRDLKMVNEMLEAERKEVEKERLRADLQNQNLEGNGKVAAANEMKAMEKCQGDNLLQELESTRQKLHDMERELHNVRLGRHVVGFPSASPAFVADEQAARVKLLQEQLKFEKKRVKHAKEVAKLEKGRNRVQQQELQRLKQDFQCLLDHLGMLSDVYGARNAVPNLPKKSSQPQMHLRGDDEFRFSSLSSRDASCLFKPDMHLRQAGLCGESTSASFSDEQLMGSQERVAGPGGLPLENRHQQIMRLKCSNELYKQKSSKKYGIVGEHSIKSSVETATGHVKKKRKIIDELKSIKDMHFEGKRIFKEADKKLVSLENTLLQPIEKNTMFPVNKCDNLANNTILPLHDPAALQPPVDSNLQLDLDKHFDPSAMQTRDSSQPLPVLERNQAKNNQEDVTSFEQMINGDYMKLLDLDDAFAEECFRTAMEKPLSPIPLEFDVLEFGQKGEAQTLLMPVSGNHKATYQPVYSVHNENKLYFTFFSDMDSGSISRIFDATRACVSRCSSLQKIWSVQDLLGSLQLEKDLRPREKASVVFSLLLLSISVGSSGKSMSLHSQQQMDYICANIHTVLFNFDTRDLCSKNCDFHEVLALSEEFILNRKILSYGDMTCELPDGCGSSIEIWHEGEKLVFWPKMASTNLVLAATIVLASISKAVGHIGFVCEASLKILQIYGTGYSLVLTILHTFAYMCGEEYLTNRNYSLVMKVVKSVVTSVEGSLPMNAHQDLQSEYSQFTRCVNCPFSEGCVLLDDVSSELLEEMQKHIAPQNPAVLDQSSNKEALSYFLGDILSSLEVIASIMDWDRVCDRIVPNLFKKLESSHPDRVFSTALVTLLGYIGRLGVEGRGYHDLGVERIKNHLLGLLHQTVASKSDAILSMAIVYELTGLCPKGYEMFQKVNNAELSSEGAHPASASSDIISKCLSFLSSEQTACLADLMRPFGVHS